MADPDEPKVLLSGHLQIRGSHGKLRSARCTIATSHGVSVFSVLGKDHELKHYFGITPSLIFSLEPGNTLRIEARADEPLFFNSEYAHKLQRYLEVIQELASRVSYTMESFDILKVLGKGYYGKVMLCRKKLTGEIYAIKTVHKNRLIKSNKIKTIFSERDTLMRARHPFIVQIYFAFQTDTKFYLGLELVSGGELFRHLCDVGKLPIPEVQLYVAEVAIALNYLHSLNIIYRDLKPENIMLDNDGHVKITDFGLAKQVSPSAPTTGTFCGTPEYLAPEVVEEVPYTDAVDWWCLGVLTYELLFGHTPFHHKNKAKMYREIEKKQAKFPAGADPVAVDFIKGLLNKDPAERTGFAGIEHHRFMAGLDFKQVLQKSIRPLYIPKPPASLTDVQNFDSTVTKMAAADSIATPTGRVFEGFSYVSPIRPDQEDEDEDEQLAPSDEDAKVSVIPTEL